MPDIQRHSNLLEWTAEITAAYVAHNTVAVTDVPVLIQEVYRGLQMVGDSGGAREQRPQPAVPVRRSVTPEYIICLEDGKKLKMLKRHLKTAYNMTPEEYRDRWSLPIDYPMVAPNYAAHRSELAKNIGLGTKPRRKRGSARAVD